MMPPVGSWKNSAPINSVSSSKPNTCGSGETTEQLGQNDPAPGVERPHLGRTWGGSTQGGSTLGQIDRYPETKLKKHLWLRGPLCNTPFSQNAVAARSSAVSTRRYTMLVPQNTADFALLAA